jgi:hypothetical protein
LVNKEGLQMLIVVKLLSSGILSLSPSCEGMIS